MTSDAPHNAESATIGPLSPSPAHPPLPAEELRWRCDPESLAFASTAEVEPVPGVIGQDAAMEALRFGLEIHAPGQNVFVRGLTGTGRMTLVRRLMEEIKPACPLAQDRCYVHNFAHPDRPRLISLPRGQAPGFRRRIDELVAFIDTELEAALSSEVVQARRAALDQDAQKQIDALVEPFEKSLREAGLTLVSLQMGAASQAALFPVVDGKPVPPEEWEGMRAAGRISDEEAERLKRARDNFQSDLRTIMLKVNELRTRHAEAALSQRHEAARLVLDVFIRRVSTEFPQPEVKRFLDEVIEDVVAHRLAGREGNEDDGGRRYRVNVVLSHAGDTSCPIIIENTPTVNNLLGTVDQRFDRGGRGQSDHLMIHAGSILRADGGYLLLDARDLLREAGAWKVLVRTLRTGRLEIVPPEFMFPWWAPSLKPEPINVDVKVILLGDAWTYYLLDAYDPDFPNLFKVLADFDSVILRDAHGIAQYAGVLARIAQEEKLLPLDRGAVAALVEHGARIADRNDRLTTRFGRLADIAREAAFVAAKRHVKVVGADDVKQSIRRSKQRADLPARRYRELLADGTIRVATSGSAVGQLNGLAVIHAGPLVYGFPTRITATIGPGSVGVINIDREAELSGSIHTKGFYILSGLLTYLLRTDHPLAFRASVAFEQSYGGIDGDSASAAEMCCLLSALTDVPLRQDLAITGAIDQVGNILAIGAANEKIEGFFDACRDVGLTGTQGVIVPLANARDLMLREDVVDACRAGKFHVYAVDTLHDAMELLTGVLTGRRDGDGVYPEDSLLGVATARAFLYWVKSSQNVEGLALEAEPGMAGAQGDAGDMPPTQLRSRCGKRD